MGATSQAPDGLLMPIFGKFTSSNPANPNDRTYVVGVAATNYFIRVYVNTLSYDVQFDFGEQPFWHYIGVSYSKIEKTVTNILVFIDGINVANVDINDVIDY